MAEYKREPTIFKVPSGDIKATLIYSSESTERLAVAVPGAGYSCKQPLLYFAIQTLLSSGYRVLTIDTLYSEDSNWCRLATEEEALKYVESDSLVLFREIQSRFSGEVHTLLGRSLGTYAIACALEKKIVNPMQIIWQCPSLQDKWSIMQDCGIRSLGIIGTGDPRYSTAVQFLPADKFVAKDADHAMEFSDSIQSIELLKQITEFTRAWLSDCDVDVSQLERNLRLSPEQRLIEHQSALELSEELARAGRRFHEQSQ